MYDTIRRSDSFKDEAVNSLIAALVNLLEKKCHRCSGAPDADAWRREEDM